MIDYDAYLLDTYGPEFDPDDEPPDDLDGDETPDDLDRELVEWLPPWDNT